MSDSRDEFENLIDSGFEYNGMTFSLEKTQRDELLQMLNFIKLLPPTIKVLNMDESDYMEFDQPELSIFASAYISYFIKIKSEMINGVALEIDSNKSKE